MDNKALAVYDPEEKPFGPLSNIYEDKIKVHKLYYNSVSNYVYSSILKDPNHQKLIENYKNYSNIKSYAIDLFNNELTTLDIESLKLAYLKRFSNPFFRKLLVETGTRKLEFVNADSTFGIGDDGKGKNIIGRILMELRVFATKTQYEIEKRQREEEENTRIYNTYMAYIVLSNLIKNHRSDLQEYIGKNAEEIIEKAGKTYNPYVYSYDVVVKLYKKGFLPDGIDRLNADIAKLVRRDYISGYKFGLEDKIKSIVFNEYINHVYDRETANKLREEVRTHENSVTTMMFLKEKIHDLYTKGILPVEVNENIERRLLSLPSVPTDQEIEDAISYKPVMSNIADIITNKGQERIIIDDDISSSDESESQSDSDDSTVSVSYGIRRVVRPRKKGDEDKGNIDREYGPHNKPLTRKAKADIYKAVQEAIYEVPEEIQVPEEPPIRFMIHDTGKEWYLSPTARTRDGKPVPWITIDNMPYPSPMDYVNMRKFGFLGNTDNVYSHGYIMNDPTANVLDVKNYVPIDEMSSRFDYYVQIYLENSLKRACATAMSAKFENNKSLQSLLVATGDIHIEYADDDPVLGVGENSNGQNFAGKYLMELRERFIKRGVAPSKIQPVKYVTLSEILMNNDTKLVSWFNMRLKDVCSAIKLFAEYLYDKIEYRSRDINVNIVRHIIYTLYNSCGYGREIHQKLSNIQVPRQFAEMVSRMIHPLHMNTVCMKELFIYMFYLVNEILKTFSENQNPDIKTIGEEISNVQAKLIASVDKKDPKAVHIKFANAIANIIVKNKNYINKYKATRFAVSNDDITYALRNIVPGATIPDISAGSSTPTLTPLSVVDNSYTMVEDGVTYIVSKYENTIYMKGIKSETDIIATADPAVEFELYKKYGIMASSTKFIRAVFDKYKFNMSDALINMVYSKINTVLYNMPGVDEVRKMSRIAFFSDSAMDLSGEDITESPEDLDVRFVGLGPEIPIEKEEGDEDYSYDESDVYGDEDEENDVYGYDERDDEGY